VAIVGDIETKATLAKMRKYFGSIPRQEPPPPVDMTEPPQTAERRTRIDDPLARLPRLDIAYKIPSGDSPDADALGVLASILSAGRSSRFNEAIVRQKQLSPGVFAGAAEMRGPGLFTITRVVTPGRDPADLEAAIDTEIEKVKTAPIADWEIAKARTSARSALVGNLGSSLSRAMSLSQYALFYDKPDKINTRADDIAKVTAADVQRVARHYLAPTARTVVLTVPKGGK
jgi:predicted Zn-dependent peptidase